MTFLASISSLQNRVGALALGLACLAVAGCEPSRQSPHAVTAPQEAVTGPAAKVSLDEEQIAANNRGVALMGKFQYRKAIEIFAELAAQKPNWVDVQVSLAIACLNEDQSGDRALPILEQALKVDPDHLAANYCMGLVLHHGSRLAEARPYLEKLHERSPDDPYVTYLLGEAAEEESTEKAMEWYDKTLAIDPYFKNAYYRRFNLLRFTGDMDGVKENLAMHQALADCPLANVFEYKYTHMGPKAMAIPVDRPTDPPQPLQGAPFADAKPLLDDEADFDPVASAENKSSITACDLNGDSRIDLFCSSSRKTEEGVASVILWQQEDGTFRSDVEHPLAAVTSVNAVVWGDFDNDGLADAYLCRKGTNQLWRQVEQGKWEDITESSKTAGGDFDTVDGAAVDADHDGDLDLFLVNSDGPNNLLNNNRDGSFQPIAETAEIAGSEQPSRSLLPADLDQDGDLDLIVLNQTPPHQAFQNELEWKYLPLDALSEFCQSDVSAAVAGDTDADGRLEIYSVGEEGLLRWSLNEAGTWQKDVLDAKPATEGAVSRLALSDVNGDGSLDLVMGGGTWQVRSLSTQNDRTIFDASDVELVTWSVANLGDQGASVVGLPVAARPVVWAPGPGRYPFVTFSLAGKADGGSRYRSNVSGVGARAELRVGSRWTVVHQMRAQSGPGQSLQPLAVGLGDRPKADFVRVVWPDGVAQIEMDLAPEHHWVEELDRMPTSCPVLFAWDGEKYSFVSDLLAAGGLGYLVAPGRYAEPDPSERFLLPTGALAVRDGRYQLKLTEPMEELTYLDRAGLVAYDLPPGWNMTLDERLATNLPRPTGEPRFYRVTRRVARATNKRGEDVTQQVREVDALAAPVGAVDRRFIGMLAQEQILVLDFESPIDRGRGEPLLVADGWVEFPYSQTVFAAWQAEVSFEPPTLEAIGEDGAWQVVHDEFGYPGGMPRQISVPLGRLPQGATKLRLRTNQEIYWDRLAIVYAEPCPRARRHVLSMETAMVREGGFMPRILLDQQRPSFEYDQRVPFGDTRDPRGYYTAFGPADELVRHADNSLAIFGPGEQIHLEFAAPTESCPANWTRQLVLELVGWCKDMDYYTADGRTVEPLPSQGPVGDQREALHARFNTRYQDGR
ncbi:MAG: FG-GAP-like repeat-containing protein [Pirellulaceae bacterium]